MIDARHVIRLLLLLLAAAVLAAGVAAAREARSAPRNGLILETNTGRVLAVESGGAAAAAGIRAGDILVAIGGVPLDGDPTAIGGLLPVSLETHGTIGVRWLTIGNGMFWPGYLALGVAACFWLAGLATALRGPGRPARDLFSLFALLAALALVCACALDPPISLLRAETAPSAFGAMIVYLWLQRTLAHSAPRSGHLRLTAALSAQAMLMALLVDAGPIVFGASSGPYLAALAALDLLLLLVAAHLIAMRSTAGDRSAPTQRRLRLALLIGIAAWLPSLLLGWAPLLAALLNHASYSPLSPYYGALSLVVLPIVYPAIVSRGDLFTLEAAARRLAASIITAAILLLSATSALYGIDATFSPGGNDRRALVAAIALLAIPAFDPFRRRLQMIFTHRIGEIETGYSGSLETLGNRLIQASDEPGIAATLTSQAPSLLGVSAIRAWLRDSEGHWRYFAPDESDRRTMCVKGDRDSLALRDAGAALERRPLQPPALLRIDQPFAPSPQHAAEGIALCVPVCIGDEPRGLLLLGPRQSQDPYRAAERNALVLLSRQVAAALMFVDQIVELRRRNAELAQLTSRLARAREEERKHLSHELHDAVAQDLVAITRQLRRHHAGTITEPIWQDMTAQAQEALTAIRRICNDLRPAILDMGLTSALRELADRAGSGPGALTARLEIQGVEPRLDEEREFALYRVGQEALSNVIKHAGASAVTITVRYISDAVELEIVDNGHGFTAPERLEDIGGDHLGLLGMRERLADLGGLVRLESHPGQGTSIWARVPVGE